ncbi:MAG: ISL3 family transposase [Gammaproteobacteria bacterium]
MYHAVEHVVQWGLARRVLAPLRAIGVDEIQYGRGHQYLTLVYQIEVQCIRLLWVGQERTVESFQRFFTMIGHELAEAVEFVCSDMWQLYLQLIEQHCTRALNILDRFHVIAKIKAIDEVRAGEGATTHPQIEHSDPVRAIAPPMFSCGRQMRPLQRATSFRIGHQ